jgi:hypothetical protein
MVFISDFASEVVEGIIAAKWEIEKSAAHGFVWSLRQLTDDLLEMVLAESSSHSHREPDTWGTFWSPE